MKTIIISAVAFLWLALISHPQRAQGATVYSNSLFGVVISKPEDWTFNKAQLPQGDASAEAIGEKEFPTLLKKYAAAPLVMITKYPEPFDDLNPNNASIGSFGICFN